jgi:hypothetical protein
MTVTDDYKILELKERIEALEKKHLSLYGDFFISQKEIAELGKRIGHSFEAIDELNGEIDILCNSLGRSNKSIYILREVLRELIDAIGVPFMRYEFDDCETDKEKLEAEIEYKEQLLAKLDGPRDQTEKKEVKFVCGSGCGVFIINEMKNAKSSEDPTLVCPKCGSCSWFITSIKEAEKLMEKWKEDSGGEKVRSAAHTEETEEEAQREADAEEAEEVAEYLKLTKEVPPEPASGEMCRTCEAWKPKEFASECEDMYNAIKPRCETTDDPYYPCGKLKGEPKAGEHFILRDDNTPNNPILRALFFGGDEEYIVDWKFRYKRKYFEIVKREDLEFLCTHVDFDAYLGDDIDDMYKEWKRIKEAYGIE